MDISGVYQKNLSFMKSMPRSAKLTSKEVKKEKANEDYEVVITQKDLEDGTVAEKLKKKVIDPRKYKIDEEEQIKIDVQNLATRVRSGEELSDKDLKFLKENAPGVYQLAMDAKEVRKRFAKELANCRSKEEVEKLKMSRDLNYLNKMKMAERTGNDSEALKQITFKNTCQNEYDKFIKTDEYEELPDKIEE